MTDFITDLAELLGLAEKATNGAWTLKTDDARKNIRIEMLVEIVPAYSPNQRLVTLSATSWKPERWGNAKPNAMFIIHAKNFADKY